MASALKVPHLRPHYPIQGLIRGLLSPSKASMLVSPAKIRPPKWGKWLGFILKVTNLRLQLQEFPQCLRIPRNSETDFLRMDWGWSKHPSILSMDTQVIGIGL